jgi:hypothetical protein
MAEAVQLVERAGSDLADLHPQQPGRQGAQRKVVVPGGAELVARLGPPRLDRISHRQVRRVERPTRRALREQRDGLALGPDDRLRPPATLPRHRVRTLVPTHLPATTAPRGDRSRPVVPLRHAAHHASPVRLGARLGAETRKRPPSDLSEEGLYQQVPLVEVRGIEPLASTVRFSSPPTPSGPMRTSTRQETPGFASSLVAFGSGTGAADSGTSSSHSSHCSSMCEWLSA